MLTMKHPTPRIPLTHHTYQKTNPSKQANITNITMNPSINTLSLEYEIIP